MAPALLTAIDSTGHVHIIVGSNSLAAARCTRSIEVGARPKLVAAADAVLPDGLKKRIETGQVVWLKKDSVDEDDLRTLGRDEVDGFVDAVFLTRGRTSVWSMNDDDQLPRSDRSTDSTQVIRFRPCVDDCVFPSMWSTPLIYRPLPFSPLISMDRCRLVSPPPATDVSWPRAFDGRSSRRCPLISERPATDWAPSGDGSGRKTTRSM